jgi:RNA polymerase sigma-70 factor (ECF subfamily)
MSGETKPAYVLSNNKEDLDSDRSISEEARQGNTAAFELLVIKHQKRMVNIAFRLLGDYDEACECVQDAFVAAYQNIGGFRGEARFSTWLTAITLNHARNRLKRLNVRSGRNGYSLDADEKTEDGCLRKDLPSREPSALDLIEERDTRGIVGFCIESLDLEYREVIVLRDLQDFSYEEIGASLGLSAGTVKSRLFRARAAVRDCLKKAWGNL